MGRAGVYRRTEKLRAYWETGAGGQRIGWNVKRQRAAFDKCAELVSKHMSKKLAYGYCQMRAKGATGRWASGNPAVPYRKRRRR